MQRYAKNRNLQIFRVLFCTFLSFDLNFSLSVLDLRLLEFWDRDAQNALIDMSLNVFLVCILREEESLVEFCVTELFSEESALFFLLFLILVLAAAVCLLHFDDKIAVFV